MNDPFAPRPGTKSGANGRLLLGLLLIGTGRAAGFAQFGASRDAFLASLAPWLGLLIVLAGMMAWAGHPVPAGVFFLMALCNLLAPAVIAEMFCRAWNRREYWGLYANVLNCSPFLMVAAFILLVPLASLAVPLGASVTMATYLALGGWFGYMVWFHWFAARHALSISSARATLVMLAVLIGTNVILQLPILLVGRSSFDELTTQLQHAAQTKP
jgi:hypothetical protein